MTEPVAPDAEHAASTGANPVRRAVSGIADVSCIIGGWALLGLSAMVGLEVVLRRAFNTSLQGADELGGYVVAVVVAFGAAAALLDRAHTRIDIFIGGVPTAPRAMLNTAAAWAMAGLAGFLFLRGLAALRDSLSYGSLSGTPLQTPLWVPQAIWVAGLGFFALIAVAVAVHCFWLLARDREALNRWYGARHLSEELAEEKASAEARMSIDTRVVGR